MKVLATVFMAVISANSLLITINGQSSVDKFPVPYTDTLLPPLADNPDNYSKTPDKVNHTTISATEKSIINYDNNSLPELSIEALLPPLLEAKIEMEDITTTTEISTTTKTKSATTPSEPSTKIADISIAANLKIPDLSLDPLVPPLLNDNGSLDVKAEEIITTTYKPFITTIKPYEHEQKNNLKNENKKLANKLEKQQLKHLQNNTISNEVINNNNNLLAVSNKVINNKNVAIDKTHAKQVPEAKNNNQNIKIETVSNRYVAKHVGNSAQYEKKQYYYNFDLYLGSTTRRPTKSGLPTITPFPHRLGR